MRRTHNKAIEWRASFDWHKWYAWHPVSDGNVTVWREDIWRRRVGSWSAVFWEYDMGIKTPKNKT